MKKITIFLAALTFTSFSFSQENEEEAVGNESFNRWTIEGGVGYSKGIKPYSSGYYSSNPGKFLGSTDLNNYNLGLRYMFSPTFGLKGNFRYDNLANNPDTDSKTFELQQLAFSLQGVINMNRLLNVQEQMGRFNFLFHGGFDIAQVKSKTPNVIENDHNFGVTEYNGGIVFGLTPQVRIIDKLSLYLDLSMVKNFRQHFSWDGAYSDTSNNLSGEMITTSLGLSFSLGQDKMHGDWAVIMDPKLEEIEGLEKRIDDMESLMNDTDKDGVPDYLDQENNSLAGVAVDTRGRMVDLNKNGVPDELEMYFKNNGMLPGSGNSGTKGADGKSASGSEARNLINGGYVAAYFDTAKTRPTNVSSQGIDFILTYLRENPDAKLTIYGHADEIGTSESNVKLAAARAESIKNVLVRAGIDAARIMIASEGEDASVDPNSAEARRVVRRVTFKVD